MIPNQDPADLVARLRALRDKGLTYAQAGPLIGRKPTATFELAKRNDIPGRQRALPKPVARKVERAIAAAKLSGSEIARKYEVAKSTVSRFRKLFLKKEAPIPELNTHRLRQPRRCPEGHLVHDWPCLSCLHRVDF